jgi:hypothetical protein
MQFKKYPPFDKQFKKLNKKYPSLPNDLRDVLNELLENPLLGDYLTKDTYKVRMAIASKGKGKSGGARVILTVKILEDKIHLLTMYDKSDQEDISDKDLQKLIKLIK